MGTETVVSDGRVHLTAEEFAKLEAGERKMHKAIVSSLRLIENRGTLELPQVLEQVTNKLRSALT